MVMLWLIAIIMAAVAWAVDLPADVRTDDAEARGTVKAMHLATWHQAAAGWYGASAANRATSGAIPQASFASRLPGGSAGSAITFTATGLHAATDGAGTVVSWVDSADLTERRLTSARVAEYAGLSMAAGSFEAATSTIVSPSTDTGDRVAVPAALASRVPDGAPIIMSVFE